MNFLYFLILVIGLNNLTFAMEKKPYHHLSDGTFRNPEGSPVRSKDVKFSYKTFTKEKKKKLILLYQKIMSLIKKLLKKI